MRPMSLFPEEHDNIVEDYFINKMSFIEISKKYNLIPLEVYISVNYASKNDQRFTSKREPNLQNLTRVKRKRNNSNTSGGLF